jgi:hypothetical protein
MTPARPSRRSGRPRRLNGKGELVVRAVRAALEHAVRPPPSMPAGEEPGAAPAAVSVAAVRSQWRRVIGWDGADGRARERSRWDWKRGLENALAVGAVRRCGDRLWLLLPAAPVECPGTTSPEDLVR